MKKILLTVLVCLIFSLSAGNKYVRPVMEMYPVKNFSLPKGLNSKVWSLAKEYPFMISAGLPQQFGELPREEAKVSLLYDKQNIYVKAVMSDSEVLSEAVDKDSPLVNCADTFCIVLRPLSETGFFYIICTPNAICSATYVLGPGSMRLASANLALTTKIPVYTAINGKLNDTKRDKAWSAMFVLPIKKMISEVKKSGINIDESRGWTLMAGRRNYSRFLEMVEISGYPQPVRGFFGSMHSHAKLTAVKTPPANAK